MVADNALATHDARIGWLIDGNPSTPHVAAMLQNTGKQIVLTLPIKSFDPGDPYARWFGRGVNFGDDPTRTKFLYKPPRVLMFQDERGVVVLVGCQSIGMSSNLSVGAGRIIPNFAVMGGRNLNYERINGLRTEIPGLALWTGIKSVKTSHITDKTNRVQRVDVKLDSPPSVGLSHAMNLTLCPSWRTSYPDKVGTFAAHDVVQLQTERRRAASWEQHLDGHSGLRELLVVSAWHPFGFSRLWVRRDDDPETVLSGDPIGPRWAEAITFRLPEHADWARDPRFLFTFEDIGTAGVRRWLKLRRRYMRAIQPLIAVADRPDAFWATRMVQSGIALEALGYQLAVDSGQSPNTQVSYRTALDRLLDDLEYNPISDVEDWKDRSTACYMGVKHADRSLPDSLVLANTLRENLLLIRLWIAGRLGAKSATLRTRLRLDPHSAEYVVVE